MASRFRLTVEEMFDEGTVIMAGDPLPGVSLEEMWDVANNLKSTQELVDAFAGASNKFWWVEDDVYD